MNLKSVSLTNFDDGLQITAKSLQDACLTLRSLYVDNTSPVKEFIDFRRNIVNYANIYRRKIFPHIKNMVIDIQDFMRSYTELTFEEFEKDISGLASDGYKQRTEKMRSDLENLINLIASFVTALEKVAEFFSILNDQLICFAKNPGEMNIHYNKCKSKAQSIITCCMSFITVISISESNLLSIPDDFDKDFVEQWHLKYLSQMI
ncbi:7316_t:CDS:2 [Dentiscutata erythropus]|uniref:7316_t:CDS:1 n=1 Tax=Dentiscutata erythropus TaxID=1348616 RepID=A0A9N8YQV0_9GLOM|nr:7316_t:CDS:2 [Dentiscutata erythropus]